MPSSHHIVDVIILTIINIPLISTIITSCVWCHQRHHLGLQTHHHKLAVIIITIFKVFTSSHHMLEYIITITNGSITSLIGYGSNDAFLIFCRLKSSKNAQGGGGGQWLQRVYSATNYNRSECTHNVQLVCDNKKKNYTPTRTTRPTFSVVWNKPLIRQRECRETPIYIDR